MIPLDDSFLSFLRRPLSQLCWVGCFQQEKKSSSLQKGGFKSINQAIKGDFFHLLFSWKTVSVDFKTA